jgi:hypothetical protein
LKYYRDFYKKKSEKILEDDSKLDQNVIFRMSVNSLRKSTDLEKFLLGMIDEIKGFTNFFLYGLFTYYEIQKLFEESALDYFTVENLSSFVITILFRNDDVFNNLINTL